ncbi:glutaredoxin 3 [Paralimibaculum aggregatum]|uniref:Glutaredoxin n=1 Tax=Paralimibaculum aggregatum TaxID=3036245 RepID=A0ABQ6LGC6_9RHOB|nr:glutaredoxin 3 [Limibaculum sp. NKW23]GMG82365.1 glutaredoxin 3 [Limibaculum sp. NKW23]
MANVEIYTSPLCGFCHRAKRLLDSKGVAYTEIDVLMDRSAKAEMMQRAEGRRTVPQIFIDGRGIGGSDELAALEREGRLDALLAA